MERRRASTFLERSCNPWLPCNYVFAEKFPASRWNGLFLSFSSRVKRKNPLISNLLSSSSIADFLHANRNYFISEEISLLLNGYIIRSWQNIDRNYPMILSLEMKDCLLLRCRLLHRRCVADRWFFELKITQVPFRRLILANILLLIRLEKIRKFYTLYLLFFIIICRFRSILCTSIESKKSI